MGTETFWGELQIAVRARRAQLGLGQHQVKSAGGPVPHTLRQIEEGRATVLRRPTRRALETALKWEPFYVDAILRGDHIAAEDGLRHSLADTLLAFRTCQLSVLEPLAESLALPDPLRREVDSHQENLVEDVALLTVRCECGAPDPPVAMFVRAEQTTALLRRILGVDDAAGDTPRASGAGAGKHSDVIADLLASRAVRRADLDPVLLLRSARGRAHTAEVVASTDSDSGVVLGYAAARAAMAALLATRGLAFSDAASDTAVMAAVEAEFGSAATTSFRSLCEHRDGGVVDPTVLVPIVREVVVSAAARIS